MKMFLLKLRLISNITAVGLLAMVSIQSFAADSPAIPVKVAEVKQAPFASAINIHGTVFGRGDVNLTAGANGQLTYVAEPGQSVRQGDVVARIDMLPLQLQRAEQQTLIRRARINLNYQKQELQRLESLAKTDAAARSLLDKTRSEHDLAESDIELAELRLKQLEDTINRATVKAPFNGMVSQRYQLAGSDISRADQLVKLLDLDNLQVKLYAPIKYLNYVNKGLLLKVSTNEQYTNAEVIAVIPAVDPKSQTFEIRAQLNQLEKQRWGSGQLVDVELPIVKPQLVTSVDRDALIIRSEGVHVIKIDAHNKAHKVTVNVGQGYGQLVEVTPVETDSKVTLNAGDRVAIRGAEGLTDGQLVQVQRS